MQIYNKIKKVFLITSSVVALLLIFLLGGKSVYAQSYVEADIILYSNGDVEGANNCSGLNPTAFGFRLYGGQYPATTTLLENDTANYICNDGGNFGYFPTIFSNQNMENGYATLNGITTDGTYWVAIANSGSAFSPDWNGNIKWFEVNRLGGIWREAGTEPEIISLSPNNATTTVSTTVDLEAQIFNDSATEVCWYLQNLDVQISLAPICGTEIFSSGCVNVINF